MRRIFLCAAALLGTAVAASAATVPYRSDAELVAISARVVGARVLDSIVERAPSAIRTRTRVVVIEDFTGGADAILTVDERGGRLADGTNLWIPGTPRFAPGDDVVLCLERTADGYRTVSMLLGVPRRRRADWRSTAHAIWRRRGRRRSWRRRRRAVAGGAGRIPARRGNGHRRGRTSAPDRGPGRGSGGRGDARSSRGALHAARRRVALAAGRQRSGDHVVSEHDDAVASAARGHRRPDPCGSGRVDRSRRPRSR